MEAAVVALSEEISRLVQAQKETTHEVKRLGLQLAAALVRNAAGASQSGPQEPPS